jgi:hypothetical protein
MTKNLLICLATILFFFNCQQEKSSEPLSDRIANYTIDCSFDPTTKLILATQTLQWRNASNDTLSELLFHTYMNAFQNDESTYWQEAGGVPDELIGNWGHCKIKSLSLASGENLTTAIQFIQPDDNNRNDQTVFSIQLPEALLPDSTLRINIEFETKLPALVERTGFLGDFFIAAQWFPKIGVYEKYRHRWSCSQYHYNSEFFADFGVYDVSITLPKDYRVAASGVLQEGTELDNGQKKWHFIIEDVHDFAWSADKSFKESKISYKNVDILIYLRPQNEPLKDRILKAAKHAYDFCTDYLGEYPYPQVSIVDTPTFASVMEYNTLFFTGNFDGSGTDYANDIPVPTNNRFPERLTIHEFAHSWWYGIVANDEAKEAWLDEGLTEFTTVKAFEKAYGKTLLVQETGDTLLIRDFKKEDFLRNPTPVIAQKSWEYATHNDYNIASYVKPRLMLLSYDKYFGDERLQPVMQAFFQRWKFKHPITRNFIDIARGLTGRNLRSELQQLLQTPGVVDFAISSVTDKNVSIEKRGTLSFPVWVEVGFGDSTRVLKRWDAQKPSVTFYFSSKDTQIMRVQIDPKNIIEFELDKTNNEWPQ